MSQTTQTTTIPQNGSLVKATEKTVDSIISRVLEFTSTGDIKIPPNYSPENAMRSAWLVLQDVKDKNGKPALEVCSKESVANAFLEMVIKGLSVVKGQGYFIVYGNTLDFSESYIGDVVIAKRDWGLIDVKAQVIYKGDIFEYETNNETGRVKVVNHVQKFENINLDNIIGAYAIATMSDGSFDTEIMTKQQIQKAWQQGPTNGNSPAHKNFPDEMSKKTVIGRLLKVRNGSANDEALFSQKLSETEAGVKHDIETKANKQEMPFDDHEVIEPAKELPKQQETQAKTTADKPQPFFV